MDLCFDHQVTAVDLDEESLSSLSADQPIRTRTADLSDAGKISSFVKEFDLVIGAVPGFMGYATLEAVIRAGSRV